ncbi:MAG: VWA domain-containing protein, partial [Bacteroidota bacterium]
MADLADRLTRWRMLLGGNEADGIDMPLEGMLKAMDQSLEALYDAEGKRSGGLGGSNPNVARWLGDIRSYFPSSVVQIMQQDALDRLGLQRMLLEPEMLEAVEADVNLVATLLSLKNVIPSKTRDTARKVVLKVVEDLQKKLRQPTIQSLKGALNRSVVNRRPRFHEINWPRTIRLNLKHYQPEYQSIIPDKLIGYGRKGAALKDVILAVDQSGSMASSVVYASVFGAVLASMQALKTHMVVFDTEVADLTEHLRDPVDLLFGAQLGGGTDIARALAYCQNLISRPK